MWKYIIIISFSFVFCKELVAQESKIIQFSGYVVSSDSMNGIPYVSIYENESFRGCISYADGFFSFAAKTGDTINFSSIGFEKNQFIIPTDLKSNKFSIIKILSEDTTYIDTVTVYPWPNKEFFKEAFLAIEIVESENEIAYKNLQREFLKNAIAVMDYDANESVDRYMRAEAQKYVYAGQAQPQNIFSPLAWAQFIEAIKRGDYKKK